MKRRSRVAVLAVFATVVVFMPANIFSCGPFWEGPTFVEKSRPGKPDEGFFEGKLGIVWPGFERRYLVMAYRYFSDKPLSGAEKDSWSEGNSLKMVEAPKDWSNFGNGPYDPVLYEWLKARSQALGLDHVEPVVIERYRATDYFNAYPNCGDDAFVNAAATARQRAKTFGTGDRRMRDWVVGQDTVFKNCGDSKYEYTGFEQKKPKPATVVPVAASVHDPLLERDRAYQIAAANFYGGQFEVAIEEYKSIEGDSGSPWQQLAAYLVARCYARKSTLGVTGESSFDPQTMQQAEAQLQSILADPALAKMHSAARHLLDYVEARLHPDQRLHEIAKQLSAGQDGEEFNRNLIDYNWLLTRRVDWLDVPAPPRTDSGNIEEAADDAKANAWRTKAQGTGFYDDMTDWVVTFRLADAEAAKHSYERWQSTRSLPWLLSTLAATHAGDAHAAEVQNAAQTIPPGLPGYTTALHHRARLLLEGGEQEGARKLLDANLAGIRAGSASDRNSFYGQRLAAANTYDDFLRFAPRTPIELYESIGKEGYHCEDGTCYAGDQAPKLKVPQRLDSDSVAVFNRALPVSMLAQAAEGGILPKELRERLALTTFLRAAMLDDTTVAKPLEKSVAAGYPELEPYLKSYDEAGSRDARLFALVFMVMHFPQMQPFMNAGPMGSIEMPGISSGSWWCGDLGTGANMDDNVMPMQSKQAWRSGGETASTEKPGPSFVTAAQKSRAKQEWERLQSTKSAPEFFGGVVLAWAKAHPDDPRMPEALHLLVRSTRYGCREQGLELGTYSKRAFDRLHRQYPDSPWTKKTRYWFN